MSVPASPAGYGTPAEAALLQRLATRPRNPGEARPWSGWCRLRAGSGSCPTRCCRSCARPTARSISTRTTASTGCWPSAGRAAARRRCCCGCTCLTSATPTRAPIVVDPKSELARLCLEMTPPDCGKRVWYLDLGRPMFGMSPLRRDPARTLPEQASAIADNIVQAISDTAEGQVFQSQQALPLSRGHRGARARQQAGRPGDVRGRVRAAPTGA